MNLTALVAALLPPARVIKECVFGDSLPIRLLSVRSRPERVAVAQFRLRGCPRTEIFWGVDGSNITDMALVYDPQMVLDILGIKKPPSSFTNAELFDLGLNVTIAEYLAHYKADTESRQRPMSYRPYLDLGDMICGISHAQVLYEMAYIRKEPMFIVLEDDIKLNAAGLHVTTVPRLLEERAKYPVKFTAIPQGVPLMSWNVREWGALQLQRSLRLQDADLYGPFFDEPFFEGLSSYGTWGLTAAIYTKPYAEARVPQYVRIPKSTTNRRLGSKYISADSNREDFRFNLPTETTFSFPPPRRLFPPPQRGDTQSSPLRRLGNEMPVAYDPSKFRQENMPFEPRLVPDPNASKPVDRTMPQLPYERPRIRCHWCRSDCNHLRSFVALYPELVTASQLDWSLLRANTEDIRQVLPYWANLRHFEAVQFLVASDTATFPPFKPFTVTPL